jgi:hypothetical protein
MHDRKEAASLISEACDTLIGRGLDIGPEDMKLSAVVTMLRACVNILEDCDACNLSIGTPNRTRVAVTARFDHYQTCADCHDMLDED